MALKEHFEGLLGHTRYEELIHYYIGYADFNIFSIYFKKKNKKAAKKFPYDGIDHLEKTATGLTEQARAFTMHANRKKITKNDLLLSIKYK